MNDVTVRIRVLFSQEMTSQYTDEVLPLQHFLLHFPAGGGSVRGDGEDGRHKHQHRGGDTQVVGPTCSEKMRGSINCINSFTLEKHG